jgi:hypothetical protein
VINPFCNEIIMIAMSNNSEIPCSACHLWNQEAKNFSCNPHKCQKLSEWLFDHAQIDTTENMQIIEAPIQYIV